MAINAAPGEPGGDEADDQRGRYHKADGARRLDQTLHAGEQKAGREQRHEDQGFAMTTRVTPPRHMRR